MDNTSIGDRMKEYEAVNKTFALRRTPVIIRVDGKAFHTWTKKLTPTTDPSLADDPFSSLMHDTMIAAATYAVKQMQNVQLAYIQSDEISFYLRDWETHETQQWFGGNVQKMTSIAAAATTAGFIQHLQRNAPTLLTSDAWPLFDARVFQLPKEEVANYFIWRQQDATRNSINMLGQFYFSHKELHGKNVSNVQDMLMLEKKVNWNDLDVWKKRGSCVVRATERRSIDWKYHGSQEEITDVKFKTRTVIKADKDIPIFTKEREYIESLI